MTLKQMLIKRMYPVLIRFIRIFKNDKQMSNYKDVQPPVSFYDLKIVLNNGEVLDGEKLKGKKLLLVNTASNCGYTPQYHQLQELFNVHSNELLVIGFPSNDFGQQEPGSDEEIEVFCKMNYGVKFPIAKKSGVIKSEDQNSVFEWLTNPAKNGWNDKAPDWNFCKYLISEDGKLLAMFPSTSEPAVEIKAAIEKA